MTEIEKKSAEIDLSKNHIDLPAFQWASKAVSEDPLRPVLAHIVVEGDKCIATDGRRLHIAKPEVEWTEGQYKIIKNIKTEFFAKRIDTTEKFPNWKMVIPEWNEKKAVEIHTESQSIHTKNAAMRKNNIGIETFAFTIKLYKLSEGMFNLHYLTNAISLDQSWWAFQKEKLGPVRIQNCKETEGWTRMAVVMPYRES